jgi:hypothetical protein
MEVSRHLLLAGARVRTYRIIISVGWVIMSDMSDATVPFTPMQRRSSGNGDALDQAGQTVMGMLQQAAAVANENCQYAVGVAHKLSLGLRAAEDRIKTLEAEISHYQDRAGRAEQWLLRISREIESKFLETGEGRPQQIPGHHRRMQQAAE